MLRKTLMIGAVMGMILVCSMPAMAGVETTGLFSLDDTRWELQNGIITGVDSIGFSEDNIYVCSGTGTFQLCLPLPNSEYTDFFIISFFSTRSFFLIAASDAFSTPSFISSKSRIPVSTIFLTGV